MAPWAIVRVWPLATEPPAHCRLASGHDPFQDVACADCTALVCQRGKKGGRQQGAVVALRSHLGCNAP
jgi:hypothetical protein